MPQGTIKKVIADKGFGFIQQIDGGSDVFFHHTALTNTTIEELHEGQTVEYEVVQSEKGPRAENITVA